jgi:hypothetical protein
MLPTSDPGPFISFSSDAELHASTSQRTDTTDPWLGMCPPGPFLQNRPVTGECMTLSCKRDTIFQIEKQEYIAV